MRDAVAAADVIGEPRLTRETQPFEQGDRRRGIGRHRRGQLGEAMRLRDREQSLEQVAAQPLATPSGRDEQADFADMAAPAQRIADQRGGSDDRPVILGDETVDPAFADRLLPRIDDARVAQVAARKQQVMLRQRRGEGEHRVVVGRAETADRVAHAGRLLPANGRRYIGRPPNNVKP